MVNRKLVVILVIIGLFIGIFILPFVLGFLFNFFADLAKPAPPKSRPPVTLNFWNVFDEKDLYEGAIQQYQSLNPHVSIFYKKYTSLEEFETDFINELAEGKGPDIISIHPSWLIKHIGKLSPMPSAFRLAAPSVFKNTFVDAVGEDLVVQNITKDSRTGDDIVNEQVYALPIHMDSLGLIYNKNLVRKYAAKNAPSETWELIQNDIQSLTRKSSDGRRIFRAGIALGRADNISRTVDIIHLLMLQQGVTFFDDQLQYVQVDTPIYYSGQSFNPAVDALQFYTSFAKDRNPNFTWDASITNSNSSHKELGAFARGEVAMIFGYSYYVDEIKRLVNQYRTTSSTGTIDPNDIAVVEVPQLLGNSPTGSPDNIALANYFPLAVTRTASDKNYAWDFINFMALPDQQRYFFNKGKKLSARVDLLGEQQQDSVYGAFAKQNAYASSVLMLDMEKTYELYAENIREILAGRRDESTALLYIRATMQCMLDKLNGVAGIQAVDCKEVEFNYGRER